MPITFNSTQINVIKFNGIDIEKVTFNGSVVWQKWKLILSDLFLGSRESPFGTFPTNETFEYVVPPNIKPKVLRCNAWVQNHTNDSHIDANVTAEIWGWNGSSWVQLKKSNVYQVWGNGTGDIDVYYTVPNVDNQYSKYSFRSTGNSFKRRVTAYLDEYYERGE